MLWVTHRGISATTMTTSSICCNKRRWRKYQDSCYATFLLDATFFFKQKCPVASWNLDLIAVLFKRVGICFIGWLVQRCRCCWLSFARFSRTIWSMVVVSWHSHRHCDCDDPRNACDMSWTPLSLSKFQHSNLKLFSNTSLRTCVTSP
jgi:hypothetical protein